MADVMTVTSSDERAPPDANVADDRSSSTYATVAGELAAAFEDNVILVYPDQDDDGVGNDNDELALKALQPAPRGQHTSSEGEHNTTQDESGNRGRKKQRHTSVSKAAFHIFKGNVGVGVFLLPMVYNDAGYLLSPILGTAVGLMVVDATFMLVRVKRLINNERVSSYPDVVRYVYGRPLQKAVNWMIVGTQLGFCLMYVQTAAGIFAEVWPFTGAYTLFVFLETCGLVPLTFLTNNLSVLAISSMLATFLVFFSVIVTFLNAIFTLQRSGVSPTTTAFGAASKWPLFVASHLTVLEGVCVVLPVENSIKKEKRGEFQSMLVRTLLTIVAMYGLYGSLGYLAFGSSLTSSTVSVMAHTAFTSFVRICLAFNLLLTHPLQFCPAIQIVDRAVKADSAHVTTDHKAIATRVALNASITVVALMVGPDALDLVLAFIGSVCATFIAVILPALLNIRVAHSVQLRETGMNVEANMSWTERLRYALSEDPDLDRPPTGEVAPLSATKIRCVIYACIGCYVLVVGTTTCIYDAVAVFGGAREDGA
jgi:proton-coupled amino acid transporter